MTAESKERLVLSPMLQKQTLDGGYVVVREQSWRTVLIDTLSGLFAPVVVSPIIALVDASIIIAVPQKIPVVPEIKQNAKYLFLSPHKFFTDPFWLKMTFLCWMVYGGTYAAANNGTSYCEANGIIGAQEKLIKVACGASANIGLTLVKDIAMVGIVADRLAGTGATARDKKKVPWLSRGCFLCRDALTMVAAFVIGDAVGRELYKRCENWIDARGARQLSNLLVPVLLQPISTVFHLYGLNYHNQPGLSGAPMFAAIKNQYVGACAARMGRIFPAVGLGNNINIALRDASFKYAERTRFI